MRSFSNGLEKHRREIINISQTFDSNNRYILFNYNQSALEPQATAFYEHFTQDHLNSLKSSGRFNSLPIGKQSIVNEPRISIPEDQNKFIQEQTCCKAFRLSNIWLFIIIIAPVSCIVIGFLYRNKCPLEKWIPLWQIVNGIVTLFFLILIFITRQISTIIVVSTDVLSQDDELNNGTINNLYNTNTTFEKSSMFKINNGFLNSIRNKLRNMKRQNTIIFITDQIKIFIILFLLAWFICGSDLCFLTQTSNGKQDKPYL
ncbi:unnamed protein product [Didymodactylos carnosus]|uniref:Transmembrane protein n=1 Tax=Didymodactylos carnosus TaxID=1234261 RepID=A0A813X7V9_9BILA|nr:unnamed protein product [Didymodactylos carnosus]CAF0862977.1 unnamed protein product [Didymodactylos carnosus]CAF3505664.1 unnamed protein product [Didymodactylos carnosus]CAF3650521.1 unnamed protein product [Didymodactylos carnosus]